jgi:hypothetical protein
MGKLLTRSTLDLDEGWYFEDAYHSYSGRGYVYEWPNPNFPNMVCIHTDHLPNKEKIKIRKWIEHNIPDTIIFDILEMDYRVYYSERMDFWDNGREILNRWYRFFFENEETALLFKLTFSELISIPGKPHPDRPDDIKYMKDRRYETAGNNS